MLALIVAAAIFARWLADLSGQPSVLTELLLGILLGNVGYWLGQPLFVFAMHLEHVESLVQQGWEQVTNSGVTALHSRNEALTEIPEALTQALASPIAWEATGAVSVIAVLAQLGVLLLLFLAGLESDLRKLTRLWRPSARVAVIGIVAPFVFGFASCYALHRQMELPGHLFLAAALAATSVGITAAVFEDLDRLGTRDSDVIFGAAVIDDILGLILLAVVVSVASTGKVELSAVAVIVLIAGLFLGVVLTVGERVAAWGAQCALKLDRQHGTLLFPLTMMLAMSWLAGAIRLAPIVGAFAAGLIIKEQHFRENIGDATVARQIVPLERFLAPVFFLFTGMQINVTFFFDVNTLILALTLTVAAVVGKLLAGLAAGRNFDRLTIGLGMVPRGEVGLIFISVGRGLGIVSESLFSALVVVVVVTTLMTPPALQWSLSRYRPST
ncbi:MAG: cation:proton antiporter [Planctomycetaceae bacterium]|nr:cation:proton antiporter [Planctomycetaceae bacterium]